ncbi:hypothetical protein VTK26DRAFT_3118 [Humicola hyalothermophila]
MADDGGIKGSSSPSSTPINRFELGDELLLLLLLLDLVVVVIAAVVNRNTAAATGRRLDVVGLNDIPACGNLPENALML